ncbi:MAG: 2-phospho-L-lactate guanylyltransferase [Geodermatophilaceae bacterium]
MAWSLVIPVKGLAVAKSRLGGPVQSGLALAFVQDTVASALATPGVGRVIVVTDDEAVRAAVSALGAMVRPDVRPGGLNEAVRSGGSYALGIAGPHGVAALPSDLPALRPGQLQAALIAATRHHRSFVPDASGTGTTLLTAREGVLDPRYGAGSAAEHAQAGAVPLDGDWPGLRRDVDTIEDLLAAHALGLGSATDIVLATTSLLCRSTQ